MKRIQLLNEYEMIHSETVLLMDSIALEYINHNTDPTTNPVTECRCRRLCGRKTCDRFPQSNYNEGESNNLP
jgi:hypothetical protein